MENRRSSFVFLKSISESKNRFFLLKYFRIGDPLIPVFLFNKYFQNHTTAEISSQKISESENRRFLLSSTSLNPCIMHRCVYLTVHITKWCSMILVSQLLCFVKFHSELSIWCPIMLEVILLAPNHLTLWRTLVSFALCIEGMCYFQPFIFCACIWQRFLFKNIICASLSCLLHRWNSKMHNNWVDSECQPPFNTPNETQDPSYNKMQMVAQWRNHDDEAMADKRGIGSRQEAAVK